MKYLNLVIIAIILTFSSHSFAGVSVIINSANTNTIDAKTIKSIYLGKSKAFSSGEKITVLMLSDRSPATDLFRQKALKKSNSQFKAYWGKLAFTGKGRPPKIIESEAAMISAVKANPAAIGFINSEQVTDDIKVIATF